MKTNRFATFLFLFALSLAACHDGKRDLIGQTEVRIETSEGDITLRLYDDTPLHRDNFIRNVRNGIYDGILFNRIVPEMVIQAGDTTLKASPTAQQSSNTASAAASVLNGASVESPSRAVTTIPAEIVYPRHFHKQGALAAAREPDSINPGKASSALQWYIVTGSRQSTAQLAELQTLIYDTKVAARFEQLQRSHAGELERLKASDRTAQQELLNALQVEAEEAVAKNPPAPFTDTQKQTYARIGGAPHLDGEYTVFGEVVEGMPIALRIGRTPIDAKEHPRRPVVIKRITIKD